MKKTVSLLFLALASHFISNATNYYFSANGNDANNGTSTSTPWKSLTKLNSFFGSLKAGDNVLFNRGEIFYGSITVNKSGSSGSPITIGAYGAGANPIITGFTTVTAWSNLGNNIWESTSTVSSLSSCSLVTINGLVVAMGRYPNSGFLTYQSFSGNTSITSSSLGSTNWTGAEAVIRKNDYVIDRCVIKSISGSTLSYSDPYQSDNATSNYGFFIQNDIRTLDAQNEWFYNPSSKKIRIYSSSAPLHVQVASINNLLSNNGYDYITVSNVDFTGASGNGISFSGGSSDYCNIQGCNISFCGQTGLYVNNGTGNSVNGNSINFCNRGGIESDQGSENSFTYNTITNIGVVVGQGYDATHADGIFSAGFHSVIKYNIIKNISYNGIFISYAGGSAMVQYNYIDSNNVVCDDGGGIYTAGPDAGVRTIDHNIILNTISGRQGTSDLTRSYSAGIYLDEVATNSVITYNTVANCLNTGLKLHKINTTIINNNTLYNNAVCQVFVQNENSATPIIYGNIMKNNIFFSTFYTSAYNHQLTFSYQTITNDIANYGISDSNYYCRPLSEGSTILSQQPSTSGVYRTLASWQSFTKLDAHSHTSPKTITDVNDLKFVYNTSSSNQTISLGATYIDSRNVSYNGSITLAPFSSAVLIKNGATTNQSPLANAGSAQTITLPTATVTLSGSGTDADGTISSYSWSKISGPTSGTITSTNSSSTTVTFLTQGTYLFQLKVTDNGGLAGINTVQVTVNAAADGSLLPAVNPSNIVNGLNYSYYQASTYATLPNFATTAATSTGTLATFSLAPEARANNIAFNFTGYIDVPTNGQYTFYVGSDDGSNIYIDNVLVVNNDGIHGYSIKSGTIGLKAGKHAISVGYFNATGSSLFKVTYSGPNILQDLIPNKSLYRSSITGSAFDISNNAISATGFDGLSQPTIKAYPNPFVNSINVNITGEAGNYKLTLLDVMGRVIWNKIGVKESGSYQQLINAERLQKGVYLLNISQNNKTSVIKLEK